MKVIICKIFGHVPAKWRDTGDSSHQYTHCSEYTVNQYLNNDVPLKCEAERCEVRDDYYNEN